MSICGMMIPVDHNNNNNNNIYYIYIIIYIYIYIFASVSQKNQPTRCFKVLGVGNGFCTATVGKHITPAGSLARTMVEMRWCRNSSSRLT